MTTERRPPVRAIIVGLAVAVVVAAGSWLAVRSNDGNGVAAPSPSTTATATQFPSQTSSSGASGRPSASPRPGAPSAPPPSPGTPSAPGTGETVSVEPVRTKDPVPLDDEAEFGTGLTVELTRIQSIKGEAKVPGEIAGPALKLTLRASNDSKAAVGLDTVIVAVSYGRDRAPAVELSEGRRPFSGRLGAGDSKDGVYVYNVPTNERDDVRVEVSYTGEAPTVAFEGSVD